MIQDVDSTVIATKLRRAINGLRRQMATRPDIALLDRLMELVEPGKAWHEQGPSCVGTILPFIRYAETRTAKPRAVVFHEIGLALIRYWELVRTSETIGLGRLLQRLEDYGEFGIDSCELLGGTNTGYSLFNRAAQERNVANAIRDQSSRPPSRPPALRGKS